MVVAGIATAAMDRVWQLPSEARSHSPSSHYEKQQCLIPGGRLQRSNGNRVRLWKGEARKLADELKLEHLLLSFMTIIWRGKPPRSNSTQSNLSCYSFHGDWNYTISPNRRNQSRLVTNLHYPLDVRREKPIF